MATSGDHDLAVDSPSRTYVLTGLGGTGKTQAAAGYARARTDVDLLAWISAESRESVLAGYARIASQIGLPQDQDGEPAHRLLDWLQNTSRTWLLVLDDLTDPADMAGLWPDGPRGHVVVTTRRTDASLTGRGRRRIPVGLFTPDQARDYLTGKLDCSPGDQRLDEADALIADLELLPLALAQAAAFMVDHGDSCSRYRVRLAKRRALMEVLPPDALADDYSATVSSTWALSIDAADRLHPNGLADPVLRLLSVLDPAGVPGGLLDTQPAIDYAAAHRRSQTQPISRDMSDAARNLARLSLVHFDKDDNTVSTHALVQRATVEDLTPEAVRDLHVAAADALMALWPPVERGLRLGQQMRANAASLLARAKADLWRPDIHPLIWRHGDSLSENGLLRYATEHWSNLVAEFTDEFGPASSHTLAVRAHQIFIQGQAGDIDGAVAASERLLDDCIRTLGEDDPGTLNTRHNLARWRGRAGDPTAAVSAHRDLLAALTRVHGIDSLEAFNIRNDLAYWQNRSGDRERAIECLIELAADAGRVLGRQHMVTLRAYGNLAMSYGEAGDPCRARDMLVNLLSEAVDALGPDHPTTLTTHGQLARWTGEAGDATSAATAFAELAERSERALGPDHPSTLLARASQAKWQGEAGDVASALTALDQVLSDQLTALSPNHPHVRATRRYIAHLRRDPQ